MSWVKIIDYENSTGVLRDIYDRIKGKDNYIDNVLKVHSLRPHTLEAHMKLYKNVLHHKDNRLPRWFMEALGIYVSLLNKCSYCVEHHFAGLKRLLHDPKLAEDIKTALEEDDPGRVFEIKNLALMTYAKVLTLTPNRIDEDIIQEMKNLGIEDGEILETNQVVSYFCYVNRTALGLGVTNEGETLGLSPADKNDPENWTHV